MNFLIKIGNKLNLVNSLRIANVSKGVDPNDVVIVEQLNSALPYKEYSALITQSGTNSPVEDDINGSGSGTAFYDTIGGTWSYNDVGSYYYTKAGMFSNAKKINVVFGSNEANQSPKVACRVVKISSDVLEIQVGELGSFANPAVFTQANGKIYLQPIQIRVYN